LGQKLSGFDLRPIWGPDKSEYNWCTHFSEVLFQKQGSRDNKSKAQQRS
jgi:hypothetical protein